MARGVPCKRLISEGFFILEGLGREVSPHRTIVSTLHTPGPFCRLKPLFMGIREDSEL